MVEEKVTIPCVPQTKTKWPSEQTKMKEKRKKEESMFVILLIIFHTLQTGVYCIGGEGGKGGTGSVGMKQYLENGQVSAVVCVQWRSTAALCSSSVVGCPGGLKAVWKPGGGEWNWLAGLAVGVGRQGAQPPAALWWRGRWASSRLVWRGWGVGTAEPAGPSISVSACRDFSQCGGLSS